LNYLCCSDCGFIYADPLHFDFTAYNEEMNEDLHDTHVGKLESPRYARTYAKLLGEFEPYRKTGRFVEIGCSTGSFLKRVKDAGWEEMGIEPVESSARFGIEQLSLNIHMGIFESAEVAGESVDVVYSNAVIEHLKKPSEVVDQAFEVLRPGGLFYADTVNIDSYTWDFLGTRWKLVDPRMHLSLFTPETLSAYCIRAGFEVKRITTHGVRFHATREDRPTGVLRLVDELRKAPYSFAARRTLRGDNIAIFAEKPA
jgi:2-polyprenyl-3-methyl-5-hydroxy-6-metoxy-1,4-benzoquinol methylase